jgi:hypothetical protein
MSELKTFVLDYLEHTGGIIEPAAFGIHEILLPEPVAEKWQTAAYQKITFDDGQKDSSVTHLGYNHPFVDQIVTEAHDQPASTRLYINRLRLEKGGLDEIAAQNWSVLNGRVVPQKRAVVARVKCSYIRFNFKAAILTDEKQEHLVSVLMDAHSGRVVQEADKIELLATAVKPDEVLSTLSDAPVRWQPPDGPQLKHPLDQQTLEALLNRARTAVLAEMTQDLTKLQKRVDRFRQLDEARLIEYYDELKKDLEYRLRGATPERRTGLNDKLQAVETERSHKLADVAVRYQVQVNLTLLNVMVIQQSKLIMPVNIENRSTTVKTHAVWDPLLHELELLVCDVCGRSGRRIYLCHNGHLAHENCLAPECVDCKRVFCRDCQKEIGQCSVCHKPLCRHSRIACSECGRGTCQAHTGMCHAADGKPLDLTKKAAPKPEPEPPPQTKPAAQKPLLKARPKPKPKPTPKKQPVTVRPQMPTGVPKPRNMEVIITPDEIGAYVLASREREIALRTWKLDVEEGGIIRHCRCEKGDKCEATSVILRPFDSHYIEKQLLDEITAFRQEYGLPVKKLSYYQAFSLSGVSTPISRFTLAGTWKDQSSILSAQLNFYRLYRS